MHPSPPYVIPRAGLRRRQSLKFLSSQIPAANVFCLPPTNRLLAHTHSIAAAMDSLTSAEQQKFQSIIEQRQMKDFMTMYSNLVQKCFDDCVNDFTSKAVSSKETSCVNNCATKFMKASERLGMRFQEANAAMMQGGAPGQ